MYIFLIVFLVVFVIAQFLSSPASDNLITEIVNNLFIAVVAGLISALIMSITARIIFDRMNNSETIIQDELCYIPGDSIYLQKTTYKERDVYIIYYKSGDNIKSEVINKRDVKIIPIKDIKCPIYKRSHRISKIKRKISSRWFWFYGIDSENDNYTDRELLISINFK